MKEILSFGIAYALILNLIGFLAMGLDKYKAKRRLWRIPERALFAIALLGGCLGSILGMYFFRHKTQHGSFVIGMPVILILQVLAVASAILTGCAPDTPKRVVKQELDLIKNLDEPTIKSFISYEDLMNSGSPDTDVDTETTKAVKQFFKHFDYKITRTTATGNSATVYVSITNLDARSLARDVCLTLVRQNTGGEKESSMSLNSYFALLGDVLSQNSYELVTREAQIELLNSDDGWQIQNTEKLEDDLVSGFISYLKDPYLISPEEMITVVLEDLTKKTPEEWKDYLSMDDIFSTYSQNYGKTDLALATQLSKYVSYKILSVTENKEAKSAKVQIQVTSLDMESVLKKYQELLMDYASTTESVRATSAELADETALLLEQALLENEDTVDTVVEIPFTNNGSNWEMALNEDFTNALLGNAVAAVEEFRSETENIQ